MWLDRVRVRQHGLVLSGAAHRTQHNCLGGHTRLSVQALTVVPDNLGALGILGRDLRVAYLTARAYNWNAGLVLVVEQERHA